MAYQLQPEPAKKKVGCLGNIVRFVLIISGLFIALAVFVAIMSPRKPAPTAPAIVKVSNVSTIAATPVKVAIVITNTATSAPTNTPGPTSTSTNTPLPTSTPLPTNTPLPTSTPLPTNTPLPTATPTNTSTATNTPLPTSTPTKTNTPTITPTFTNTPLPTATPLPTDTPTSTPTSSPLDLLKQAIAPAMANCSGDQCKYSAIEFDTDSDGQGKLVARFMSKVTATDTIGSVKLFNLEVASKIFYTLEAVSKLNVDYDAVAFEFEVPVVDKYGNSSVQMGISCLFNRDTVKRINYSNILIQSIVDLADRAYVNPVLRQDN